MTQLSPVPVTRSAVRWSLGHALPSSLLRRAAKQGDLHGRMFVATQSSGMDALEPIIDELRGHSPFYRGKFASVSVDNAAVRALLSNPDAGAAFGPADQASRIARLQAWSMEDAPLGPAQPTLPAGDRAAGPHPLPQARLAGLQRPGRRAAARSHPADRHRPPRPDRPEQPGGPGRDVLQPAARHRDRRDPRRAGGGPREGAAVRRSRRAEPGPRACRGGSSARSSRRCASSTTGWATTSTACVGSRVRTCSASSSPPRRTGSA